MMYLALPLREGGRTVDVVRAAVPLTAVNEALGSLYTRIVVSALSSSALVAAVIGLYVSRRISGQMREIKAGAERLAAGDFSHKLVVPRTEEFAVVAESLNHMADELDDKLSTLTQERNEREAVLSSMVEGVLAVDTEERVIAVNAAAARLLGHEARRGRGQVHPGGRPQPRPAAGGRRRRSAGNARWRPTSSMRVGAEDRDLQANGTLLHAATTTSGVVGAVVVLNDVTRLKRLEAVRRDFVANVSHELKTPVTSIKGFAETLEDGALDDPEAARRFVRIIAGQADRLNSIIEDLLALSTLEQSQDSPLCRSRRPTSVTWSRSLSRSAGPRRRPRTSDCARPARGRLLAPVSPPLLEQAVVNLIDNAVKYSPEGSTVDVVARGDERRAGDQRRRQGAGRRRASICRGSSSASIAWTSARSRDLGGTGLGLAIVKHIAQIHGGRVSVDSVVGQRQHLPHPSCR